MRMSLLRVVVLVSVSLVGAAAKAQAPKDNPIVAVSQKLGEKGFVTTPPPKTSPLVFKPTDRFFVRPFLTSLYGEGKDRDALEKATLSVIEAFETSAKEAKIANDGSAALAFSVALLYAVVYSAEVEQGAIEELTNRFRASFDVPAVRDASDKHKQEFYEWALASAGMVIAMAAGAESPEQIGKVQALATVQIKSLIGADVANLVLKGKTATLIPAKKKADGGGS